MSPSIGFVTEGYCRYGSKFPVPLRILCRPACEPFYQDSVSFKSRRQIASFIEPVVGGYVGGGNHQARLAKFVIAAIERFGIGFLVGEAPIRDRLS